MGRGFFLVEVEQRKEVQKERKRRVEERKEAEEERGGEGDVEDGKEEKWQRRK